MNIFYLKKGSSLGLWFGLSVFGLTDLGIAIINYIKSTFDCSGVKNQKKVTNYQN